jgi:hypothetical protein
MKRSSSIVLFLICVLLFAAQPVAAARRVTLDVLIVADTSDSMFDELQALCAGASDLAANLDRRGVTLNVVVMGVVETRSCADVRVTRLLPAAQAAEPEDWGVAVADLARHYSWTPGAVRLIIPLSDEGPFQGDPVNTQDEQAIADAIQAAQESDVVVSPILGAEFNPAAEPLARQLAQETDGRVFVSKEPATDLMDGVRDLVWAAAERGRASTSLVQAIPTPRDVVFDGRVVSANLMFAILMTLVLGVATAVLSNMLDDHGQAFRTTRLSLLMAAAVNVYQLVERVLAPGEWSRLSERPRRWVAAIQLIVFLALVALLSVFLQPELNPLSWRGLGLWLGALMALLVVTAIFEGAHYGLALRLGAAPALRLRPGGLLAVAGSVFISRLFGVAPGFFFPRITACTATFPDADPRSAQRRRARVALGAGALLGAVGLSLWGLTWLTSLLLDGLADLELSATLDSVISGVVQAVQGFFGLGFFLAWQMLFFEALPWATTTGSVLFGRSRALWAGAAGLVLFVLLQALVNPFGAASDGPDNRGLVVLGLSLLLYSALAVGVWLFFALRASESSADWGRSQRTTVMAISLVVLWVIGACAGLVIWIGRLF